MLTIFLCKFVPLERKFCPEILSEFSVSCLIYQGTCTIKVTARKNVLCIEEEEGMV